MSHFTVLVIGDDVEGQLAPYQENNMRDCPEEYLEFNDVSEEFTEQWTTKDLDLYVSPEGEKFLKYDSRFRVCSSAVGFSNRDEYVLPERWTHVVTTPEESGYWIDDDNGNAFTNYVADYHGYERNEDGKFGYWENPNAKWDWYVVGGRWNNFFKLKEGCDGESGEGGLWDEPKKVGYADIVLKQDIDFYAMRKEAGDAADLNFDKWEQCFVGKETPLTFDEIAGKPWPEITREERDRVRAAYLAQPAIKEWDERSKGLYGCPIEKMGFNRGLYRAKMEAQAVSTYAVVMDGKWYAKGEMGWWGMSNDNTSQEDWNKQMWEMIEDLPGDTVFTLIDCHI